MIRQNHQYLLELYDSDRQLIGRTPVAPEPDWIPAIEHAHFAAVRRGAAPVVDAPPVELKPMWHPRYGEPTICGIRIGPWNSDSETREPIDGVISIDYFKREARLASSQHVKSGRLRAGETFYYRVIALAGAGAEQEDPARQEDFGIEEVAQALPLTETAVDGYLARAVRLGSAGLGDEDDLPVFVAEVLIEQAVAQVRQAGAIETAGILLGRLHRDPGGIVFLELTAQLPARCTEARETKVTFTPDTWAAARDALQLRQSDEAVMGWWHSHPDWCRTCTCAQRDSCGLAGIFFSSDDCALHRAIFPKAWQVGLLLSDRTQGIIPALFSWRCGQIKPRPFFILAEPGRRPAAPVLSALGAIATKTDPDAKQPQAMIGGDEYAQPHTHGAQQRHPV